MSNSKKTKFGAIGTLLVVIVALVGIFGLVTLCKNILKDGKVEYIMDMGRNSGSGKDATLAGDMGYEDSQGRLCAGNQGTSLLDIKDAIEAESNSGGRDSDYIDDPLVQSVPGAASADMVADNDGNNLSHDALGAENGNTVEAGAELTAEEIDILVDLARYLTASEGYMGVALDQYNLPINDEIAMTTIDIIANEYMSGIPDAVPFVISDTYDGSKITVSKADIDAYVKNVFGYEGLSSYSYAGIQDNGDTCDIWCHEGVRESTSGFSGTYMEGDIYVVTGGIVVNASSGSDPFFVEVDYTLRVRRNSESPIGFTFVELQLGTAEPQY